MWIYVILIEDHFFPDPLDSDGNDEMFTGQKRCPSCFTIFNTHLALFQHQIGECKSHRDISITNVMKKTKRIVSTKRTPLKKVIIDPNSTPKCIDCNIEFSTFHVLNTHRRFDCKYNKSRKSHSKSKSYRCECGTRFGYQSNLLRHKNSGRCERLKQNKSTTYKLFYCVDCKLEYSTLNNLRRHKQTRCSFGTKLTILPSMKEPRVACPDCGVTFSRQSNLSRHRKTVKCAEQQTTEESDAEIVNSSNDDESDQ